VTRRFSAAVDLAAYAPAERGHGHDLRLGQGNRRVSWVLCDCPGILKHLDSDRLVAARGDGDTWYLISDADLIAVQDETFGTGLDTWDF
jgi:hypothetical protein